MALEERLRLIVDATTGAAEANFGKLSTEAERTATAADTAAESVAAAADTVARARAKEADAAGKLAVEEDKLARARAKYGDDSAQVVAAEERVASAQRKVQLAASDTANALEAQEGAQRTATEAAEQGADSTEKAGKGTENFKEQVGGLKDTVVGLVAGVSLADWMSESVNGFLEGARGASSLAQAMNATVEEAGQLNTLMETLGLEMDDVLEIQASFAQVLDAQPDLLESIGASMKTNADGTTNWALTLEDTLAQLQKIPDATRRNQLGFQLFGEEGYKQLSRLLLSGRSVHDALEAIGTPFTEEDVEATRKYDQAMSDLSSTGGSVSRELGSVLVPIITAVVQAFGAVVDIVTAIPGPIGIATVAAVVLGLANRVTAESGGLLAAGLSAAQGAMARFTGAAAGATVGTGAFAAAAGVARVAGGGLVSVLGGPLGIAMVALAVGFTLLNSLIGRNSEQAQRAEQAQQDLASALEQSNGVVTDAVRQQAALSAQESGLLAIAEKAGVAHGTVTDAILGNRQAYNELSGALDDYIEKHRTAGGGDISFGNNLDEEGDAADDARGSLEDLRGEVDENSGSQQELAEELGQTTDKAALAQAALDALTGIVDAGTIGGYAFSEAVHAAADAQDDQSRSSDIAKAAIEAYHASTDGAVQATLDFFSAQLSLSDQSIAVQKAYDDLAHAVDDLSTPWNEVAEAQNKAVGTTLAYAKSSGDAAVAGAKAQGVVVDAATEAQIRAKSTLDAMRAAINQPGLTDEAKAQIEGMIDSLEDAQSKGDINAILSLTGVDTATGELDEATGDRETHINVESRGGPAVDDYLDKITNAARLAIVRVESRGGPDVDRYLDGLSVGRDRLAIIRVETRGGPAVDEYLGALARERLAIIRVETRGGPAVQRYLDDLAADRSSRINVGHGAPAPGAYGMYGAPALAGAQLNRAMVASVSLDLELVGRIDRGQLSTAERGRARVEEIRAYEARNGTGWRR